MEKNKNKKKINEWKPKSDMFDEIIDHYEPTGEELKKKENLKKEGELKKEELVSNKDTTVKEKKPQIGNKKNTGNKVKKPQVGNKKNKTGNADLYDDIANDYYDKNGF